MNTVIKPEFDREKSIELLVDKILDDLDWNTLHQIAAESLYNSYSKNYSDDELRYEMVEYEV
jgi:predicted hydrolase (HD superfamily)